MADAAGKVDAGQDVPGRVQIRDAARDATEGAEIVDDASLPRDEGRLAGIRVEGGPRDQAGVVDLGWCGRGIDPTGPGEGRRGAALREPGHLADARLDEDPLD